MNRQEEFAVKRERVEQFLSARGLDGAVLGRSDSFAWLGCGADNVVDSSHETGVGALVVEAGRVTLLANNIETDRLMAEELSGLDIGAVETFPWHDPEARTGVLERFCGRRSFAADDGSPGLTALPDGFVPLRYSLTAAEVERFRGLGLDASRAMERTAAAVQKGMTEAEVAAWMAQECLAVEILPVVLLVAADGRLKSWRHPIVKGTPVRACVMVVLCGRRQGLVAAVTRIVHFGELPDDLARRHRAVCTVDAAMMLATKSGQAASQVLAVAQEAYRKQGFPDEWKLHHQGGAIGYAPREYIVTPQSHETVRDCQAFAWNPSVRGTKSEDTILVTGDEFRVLTEPSSQWPTVDVEVDGRLVKRPDILAK